MDNTLKRKKIKTKIILESLIVFFIAVSPFLYKIYDYLPVNDPEKTVSFLWLTISSNGFHDVSTYVWFLTVKIVPLYLLIFWFFTSKDWWYHIILIPIAMYSFQVFEAVYLDNDFIDTENIWWLLPVLLFVIPFVYLIRIKLYDKYVNEIDLEAMEAELEVLKEKQAISNRVEDPEKACKLSLKREMQKYNDSSSFSDILDEKLSTHNVENRFRQLHTNIKGWLHLKF